MFFEFCFNCTAYSNLAKTLLMVAIALGSHLFADDLAACLEAHWELQQNKVKKLIVVIADSKFNLQSHCLNTTIELMELPKAEAN